MSRLFKQCDCRRCVHCKRGDRPRLRWYSDYSTLELPLYTEADYFTLDIYDKKGESLYATGCLLRQARTFRVSNLETVENASIIFHYYSDVSCEPAAHVGVGVRGMSPWLKAKSATITSCPSGW